jgi:hypothetical protein
LPTGATVTYAELWTVEHRMTAERQANDRLARAAWVLVFTTLALVGATLVLAYVTAVHH